MNKETNINDVFEILGGANEHGQGKQLVIVHTITKQGNIYCYKFSTKGKLIAKKFKLVWDDVIRRDTITDTSKFFNVYLENGSLCLDRF